MAKQYRKKPDVVEAIQWTGSNLLEVREFCGHADIEAEIFDAAWEAGVAAPEMALIIDNDFEGRCFVNHKDYVIKDVRGRFSACPPDIFKQTYEQVQL